MKASLFSLLRTMEHRLLDMLGRDKCSTDYGLFARRDELLAQPALQCPLLPLARLVSERSFSSPLCGEEIPTNWARSALLALHGIQQPGGAFGRGTGRDWTGLILYQAILAYRKLGRRMDDAERTALELVFLEAGRHLIRCRPASSLRRLEGALALLELFRLTGNRDFENHSRRHLQELLASQQPAGCLPEADGFDARQHFIVSELAARCHFLQKSDLTRALLKPALPLLQHLQRPDGTLENEMFEREDFLSLPGYLLHLRREWPAAPAFLQRLTEGARREGERILPWQHRLEFAVSGYRLFSTLELLYGENGESFPDEAPPPEAPAVTPLPGLGLTVMCTRDFKFFVHPRSHRVKIFNLLARDGALVYADSGYRLDRNGETWLPCPAKKDPVCEISAERIAFPFVLAPSSRRLLRRPRLNGFREILLAESGPRFVTRFLFPQDPGPFRVARIYSRRTRIFRPEDIRIPSFEDLPCRWQPIGGEAIVRENLERENGRWFLRTGGDEAPPL